MASTNNVVQAPGHRSKYPEQIRRLRAERGLSQRELAEALGVSAVTVNRWEQGRHQPAAAVWRMLLGLTSDTVWSSREVTAGAGTRSSMPAAPSNIPLALSTFVGRERELSELTPLVRWPGTRLLTLTGVGGSGKTRLALALAGAVETHFAAGVCLAELAPLADPADLPAAVATALGLHEQPGLPPIDVMTSFLQSRQLLLLLDNCEHLVAACAGLAESLLRGCPDVRILATSRQALGVEGENVWVVPPLDVPPITSPLDSIARAGAVRLFVERGQLQQPGFSVAPDNAGTIAQICHQLEGLPLALELAAGWLRLLPVSDLAARLPTRQNLLSNTNRLGPARHQTLQAAIDWSYGLLGEAEQTLFRRLGVFAGGFTVEAAEGICANADDVRGEEVLELLAQLLEKSLVEREQRAGDLRLRLLEPLRQYASERLQASGERETMRARHAQWYLALAEQQELRFHGPEEKRAFDRLEREHDNLRGALRWAEDQGEIALRLVAALWLFWLTRSYFSEARRWLDGVLAATSTLQIPVRAIALNGAACLAWRSGVHDEVFARCAESFALSQASGDTWASAVALHFQAAATMERGELDEAAGLHERSLELFREGKRTWWVALSLGHLAIVRQLQGNADAAGELAKESLARFRQTGDAVFTAHSLDVVGFGWEQRGDLARAARCYREALSLHAGQDERSGVAVAFMRLASVAGAQGQWERAASLFGSMDAVLRLHENTFPKFYSAYADSHLAQVQEALDEDTFARAWTDGQSMPLAVAVDFALAQPSRLGGARRQSLSDRATPAQDTGPTHEAALPEDVDGLSQRELEVLNLLALGRSNKQISQVLTLSVRTVERHIANVYLKIGAHGRAGATSYAFHHGLAPPA